DAQALGKPCFVHLDSETWTDHSSVLNQLGHRATDGIDGDCKPDSGGGTGRAVDGSVDADETSRAIEQRASRVPRIDGRVRLDRSLNGAPSSRHDLPPEATDHSRRKGVIEAKWVPDGKDILTDEEILRCAHLECAESFWRRLDVKHCNIFRRMVS